jgi:selenide,water dikinase
MTTHRVLLVGGGHAHVQVMRALAERPEPGLSVSLATDRLLTPYSGMLPGYVAGFYSRTEMHIDLARLAGVCGVTLIPSAAIAIDRENRRVSLQDGGFAAYDTLSLNVGVTPDVADIAGAERHAVAVKPIGHFLDRLDQLLAEAERPDGPRRILLIGGGAAGVELALAIKARLQAFNPSGRPFWIGLASGGDLVATLNSGVRRRVRAALARRGVTVLDEFRAAEVTAEGVRATDGRFAEADAVLISTAAQSPSWLQSAGLPMDPAGFLQTDRNLACIGDPAIFAVGDCGTVAEDPRPKAGVFAVRQGPALTENIRRRVRGAPLAPHQPDRKFLAILMTGDGSAIAGRGDWFAAEGKWVWRWKDWIDRRFMRRFSEFRRRPSV